MPQKRFDYIQRLKLIDIKLATASMNIIPIPREKLSTGFGISRIEVLQIPVPTHEWRFQTTLHKCLMDFLPRKVLVVEGVWQNEMYFEGLNLEIKTKPMSIREQETTWTFEFLITHIKMYQE